MKNLRKSVACYMLQHAERFLPYYAGDGVVNIEFSIIIMIMIIIMKNDYFVFIMMMMIIIIVINNNIIVFIITVVFILNRIEMKLMFL